MRTNRNNPRPRNVAVAFKKFMEWNRWGLGKVESSCRTSTYWHRDDIFYRGWTPAARCLHAEGHGTVLFRMWDQHCGMWRVEQGLVDRDQMFDVQNICVWGPGKGMAIGKDEFLQCIRMQWLSQADWYVEDAHGLSYERCHDWHNRRELLDANGRRIHSDWKIDHRLDAIAMMGKNHQKLSDLFKLGWPAFPAEMLCDAFMTIVEQKAARYDVNLPKRERAMLRKEGVKALTQEAAE